MNGIRIAYYASTGLLTALMLFSSSMYVFNHEMVATTFTKLPTDVPIKKAKKKANGCVMCRRLSMQPRARVSRCGRHVRPSADRSAAHRGGAPRLDRAAGQGYAIVDASARQ